MISRTLKNKKKFSKYLKISIIVLLVITISLITYKIYFNNKSSKQLFQSIKKQDELCNLDLVTTPFSIYKDYYITTTNNDSYIVLKISRKEYSKLMNHDFKDTYNIKGISKILDGKPLRRIKLLINNGKIELKGKVLYLDASSKDILNTTIILSIVLIIINLFLYIINTIFIKTINISNEELKKLDKEKYKKYGKLYISDNYIFIKNTFDIININKIIVMYEKNNIIYLITEFNEIYKFKNNKHYDLIEILMDKNKDIIVGINSDIKKQIKKKYNITLKEV